MSIEIIDLLKPKNGGDFPIVEAEDVAVGTVRLSEALNQKVDTSELAQTNATVAGKADTSALSSAAANLQSQIDSLITPVTQDAEVENARVNTGGTSFTTLKERLDDSEDQADTAFYVTSKGNIESGSWSNGSKIADVRRLRTKTRISAPVGSVLDIDTKNLYVLVTQYATDVSEDAVSTGWLGGKRKISLEYGYFTILIANAATFADSTAIVVNDYTCEIRCIKSDLSGFGKDADVQQIGKIITLNSQLNIEWLSKYENGGLNLDGTLNPSQKYRVSSKDFVTYTEAIKITAKTGYRFGWVTDGIWKGWYSEATIPKNTTFKLQLAKTTEDTSEYADVATFINSYTTPSMFDKVREESKYIESSLLSYTSWLQGTIGDTGQEDPTRLDRCRTKNHILYHDDMIISLTNSDYKYGVHFYDSQLRHLSNTSWIADARRIIDTVNNAAYIKFVIAKVSGDNIAPADVPDALFLDLKTKQYINDQIEISTASAPYSYIGEKMPTKHYFDADSLFSMSYSGITSQDIDIYDTYMFVAFSGTEQIKIYSLTDYTLITSIEIPVHHGSSMQFSAEFYDPNDDFPLLYVGGWEDNLINVIRISRATVDWTAEVIRTIKLPTTYGYYLSPSIDTKNNILYAYGHTNGSIPNTDPMMISKWNLSQLTDNGDNTYTPEYISSVESPSVGTYQGHKFLYNRLFVGASNTSSPFEPTIYAIDVNNGNIVSKVDLSPFLNEELEGVCYNFTNGKIEWYCSGYHPVFKLDFS